MVGIYKIQSVTKPNKIYIGSAINIENRWYRHLYFLNKRTHENSKLQRHYDKYGIVDLQFSILLIGCDVKDLIYIEQLFLDSYKPWFNICKIANSRLGVKVSEEVKEKMRSVKKGKKFTEQHKKNMSISKIGKPSLRKGRKFPRNKK